MVGIRVRGLGDSPQLEELTANARKRGELFYLRENSVPSLPGGASPPRSRKSERGLFFVS